MANVLLIDPPWYALQNIYLPRVSCGLASLAAVLKKHKHNCIIYNGEFGVSKPPYNEERLLIDFRLYRLNLEKKGLIWRKTWSNIKRIINDFNPLIIGITMPTAKYSIAIKIANQIKREFPYVTIVVGGPHPTIQPLETIKEASFDIVVKGEGESTFLELVNSIEQGKDITNISGITFKSGSTIYDNPSRKYIEDIDSLPFSAWDLTYESTKHSGDCFGAIFTSRGCPYRCIFCASHKIWGRKVRYMSAERVVAELEYTSRKYKTDFFHFHDDTFILNRERIAQICEKIKKNRINIKWECEVRADLCTYEILKIMKSAGCVRVNIGVESGNSHVLKYIKKGITLKQIYRAFEAIKKAGLGVMTYYMIGFPDETVEQVNDTIELMDKLKNDHDCWSVATPYPGTELYNSIVQEGLWPGNQNWSYFFHHSPKAYISKKIDYSTLMRIIRKIEKKVIINHKKKQAERMLDALFGSHNKIY